MSCRLWMRLSSFANYDITMFQLLNQSFAAGCYFSFPCLNVFARVSCTD